MSLKPIEQLTPRRQRRRRRNQEDLVDAATRVFERLGYVDATIQDVIEEADIGRGTFYNYFESKEDIFAEILRQLVAELVQAGTELGEERSVRQRIHVSMSQIVTTARRRAKILSAAKQAIHTSEDFAAIWDGLRAQFVSSIDRDLDWCQRHEMTGPMDTEILAALLTGLLETAMFEAASNRRTRSEDLERTLSELYWNAVFRPHENADDYIIRPGDMPEVVLSSDAQPRA